MHWTLEYQKLEETDRLENRESRAEMALGLHLEAEKENGKKQNIRMDGTPEELH